MPIGPTEEVRNIPDYAYIAYFQVSFDQEPINVSPPAIKCNPYRTSREEAAEPLKKELKELSSGYFADADFVRRWYGHGRALIGVPGDEKETAPTPRRFRKAYQDRYGEIVDLIDDDDLNMPEKAGENLSMPLSALFQTDKLEYSWNDPELALWDKNLETMIDFALDPEQWPSVNEKEIHTLYLGILQGLLLDMEKWDRHRYSILQERPLTAKLELWYEARTRAKWALIERTISG